MDENFYGRNLNNEYSLADLSNSNNPYNEIGYNYYKLLFNIKENSLDDSISSTNDLEIYLSLNNVSLYSSSLDNNENELLHIFFTNFNVNDAVSQFLDFEDRIISNYGATTYPELLKKIAILKYGFFSHHILLMG